jgi:DNA modification methylase
MDAKSWMKSQIGVWQFFYEKRDVRDKEIHPATFPINLAKRTIELFTHEGELVIDPFVGSGTTLVAAWDLNRNAVGFDINKKYIEVCKERLSQSALVVKAKQIPVHDDARNISQYFAPETISLLFTSPPYANLLNRPRLNKSRRGETRNNGQLHKVEQYSQDPNDLGTLPVVEFSEAMRDIYAQLLPLLKPKAHCVINVSDIWWEGKRVPIHVYVIHALQQAGYELRNTIIWDRTNIVNRVGIFGWPSNYITMGTTYEYLLDFWKPPAEKNGK